MLITHPLYHVEVSVQSQNAWENAFFTPCAPKRAIIVSRYTVRQGGEFYFGLSDELAAQVSWCPLSIEDKYGFRAFRRAELSSSFRDKAQTDLPPHRRAMRAPIRSQENFSSIFDRKHFKKFDRAYTAGYCWFPQPSDLSDGAHRALFHGSKLFEEAKR